MPISKSLKKFISSNKFIIKPKLKKIKTKLKKHKFDQYTSVLKESEELKN